MQKFRKIKQKVHELVPRTSRFMMNHSLMSKSRDLDNQIISGAKDYCK